MALKMISPRLVHKTEAGAVVLNLKDEEALKLAVEKMRIDVNAYDADAVVNCFWLRQCRLTPWLNSL